MTTSARMTRLTIALVAASLTTITASKSNAAIVTIDNSGSWINGANTLENQGFNLIQVPNGNEGLGSDLSTLSSPLGNIEFSPSVNKRQVGNPEPEKRWRTWSNNYQGEVYFTNGALTLDLKLPNLVAFDFYAQPDTFFLEPQFQRPYRISAIAQSGETSDVLSQLVNGNSGAQYFGFYSDDPLDPIQSIQITSEQGSGGFAIGQLRGASATATVPTPLLLPGIIGLGLGLWRKARSQNQQN
ncbi:PTPA-CTERM sorting domain-containing protein [Leptolyngbya sp. DQ-M1]|uniref:PTPA-CTERM sorting domain-containing protein n=1 Tax=Leptolyngbya sp. DQ-M1 TaxID=2933920 RepID=UPI0032980D4E